MGVKHSSYRATAKGERANSSGRPRATRTDAGLPVDIDGVPTKYTKKSDVELPPEFWADFKIDPAAAIAKWTADEV